MKTAGFFQKSLIITIAWVGMVLQSNAQDQGDFYFVDLNKKITREVEFMMREWIVQGEFEPDYKYNARMAEKEKTIEVFTAKAIEKLMAEYLKKIDFSQYEIGKYEPNQQFFPVVVKGIKTFNLPVPLSDAPNFKADAQVRNIKFLNPKFIIQDNNWVLSSLDVAIASRDKKYNYDVTTTVGYNPRSTLRTVNLGKIDIQIPNQYNGAGGISNKPVQRNNITFDGQYDVRSNIPITSSRNLNAFAVIICNQNYQSSGGIANVDFAIEDGTMVKDYLIKSLGFSENNIIFHVNATKGTFETIFGNETNHMGRLAKAVRQDGTSEIFVFYSGHGAPGGPQDSNPYFVPIECTPNDVSLAGYSLNIFYQNLSKIPAKRKTVVIDACFSGRDVFTNISPVGMRVKNTGPTDPSITVLASAMPEQVSSWYPSKQQGLFTYLFLKSIHDYKNSDLDKDGNLSYQEIFNYVSDKGKGVPAAIRALNQPEQTPVILGANKNETLVQLK